MTQTAIVLIIDDNEIDREIFHQYLLADTQNNYEIFEAEHATEALDLCQRIQCDLILLDFRLPGMSGLEFLQEQQRQQSTTTIPTVIMMTGVGDEALAVRALQAGAINYLPKQELQAEELIQAVQNALRQHRLRISSPNTIMADAAAASILRFRRTLALETIAESAAAEIRYLTRCDRVSIVQSAYLAEPRPVAQNQTVALTQYLKQYEATQLRRRGRRGRPRQNRPTNLRAITSQQFPIQLLNQRLPWGWVALDYLPDAARLSEQEKPTLEQLVEQLAIAIGHAEQYQQLIQQVRELQQLKKPSDEVSSAMLIKARQILGNLLLTASTLSKHRVQFSELRQDQFLHQLKLYSQEFIQLLEETFSLPDDS